MKIYPPLKSFTYAKRPQGDIYQLYGESKELYRKALSTATYDFTGGHNGIDCMPILDPRTNDNFVYCTEGKVLDVKDTPTGYGKHVRILTPKDENGNCYEVTYGHLREIFVKVGQKVVNDELLGVMGNTGFIISGGTPYWGDAPGTDGTHLHLTVRAGSFFPTPYSATYPSGDTVFIQNYENGAMGAIDPLPLLAVQAKLSLTESILTMFRDLLRKLILLRGQKPVA